MNTTVGQANADSWTWPTRCEWSLAFGSSLCKFYQPSTISLPLYPVTLPFSWPAEGRIPFSPHSTCVTLGVSLPTELGFLSKAHTPPHHNGQEAGLRLGVWNDERDQHGASSYRLHLSLRGIFIDPLADRAAAMPPGASPSTYLQPPLTRWGRGGAV